MLRQFPHAFARTEGIMQLPLALSTTTGNPSAGSSEKAPAVAKARRAGLQALVCLESVPSECTLRPLETLLPARHATGTVDADQVRSSLCASAAMGEASQRDTSGTKRLRPQDLSVMADAQWPPRRDWSKAVPP